MADQRILMKCGEREIVIAVRHGDQWRTAAEDGNDIGDFLNAIGSGEIKVEFESPHEWPDPTFICED